VAKFKYLRATLTNQNYIHEETDIRLNLINAFYHSVQCLSSRFLPKIQRSEIHKTVVFLLLYTERNLASHVKGELWIRVFENRVLKRIFRPKKE
jgi:hypothetical protein